jgi:hypothetical protein
VYQRYAIQGNAKNPEAVKPFSLFCFDLFYKPAEMAIKRVNSVFWNKTRSFRYSVHTRWKIVAGFAWQAAAFR